MLYRLLTYSYKKHFSAVFYIQMFRSCFPARCSTLPQYLSLAQPTAVRLHCVPLTSRTPFSAEHGFMLEVCRVLSYVVCLSVSFSVIFCDMLAELEELDKSRAWPRLFQVRCPCLFLNFRQNLSIHQCLMLTCLLVN